ncbi:MULTISPECIES: LysR family transcriptional regulator [unclassified Paenibacillus]|uniref:LysR family transcriptional regulator n=1 Tax=unclassified Paenibacillus TaxID=185978 RepID=UPI000956258B|nr:MULTISPECIES: LysR family transcriptional regulator [unclassified Paenibacillus]ASS66927.1 LysR family transcriptional regulator [Paenibacillus sp. RUD330]SIR51842.1 DNA-binding transcriptional regulator, LysR family [Paenibacillus sp. RU4X]SIR60757.1 DNA-binding transcriptional regulator, LysR family [Paenibacillus sp. RU4T]
MELLQLQYFQTVARLEHMTRAAEELKIAQPSLSKTISRLEDDLGVPLFDRQGRQLRLNSFGRAFLERVDKAFVELLEGRREIRQLAGLQEGSVTIAVSLPHLLPGLLGPFLTQFPLVRLRQRIGSSASMKRQLESGEADLILSSAIVEGKDVVWEPLYEEEIFLLAPASHRLSGQASVRLEALREERFISMNAGHDFRVLTDRLCGEAGFSPFTAFEGDEPQVIGNLVRRGLGVAFVPELSVNRPLSPELRLLKLAGPSCRRTIGMAFGSRRYLSEAAQQFRRHVRLYFDSVGSDVASLLP